MAEPYLIGPRVRLRPLERTDLPRYGELLRDPEFNLLSGGQGNPYSLQEIEAWYDAGKAGSSDGSLFLVIDAEGAMVGIVSLKNDANMPSRAPTFGVSIGDPNYLGKGYGAEASVLLLDYAFGVLGCHKVNLDFFEYNARAQALYEKLGFVVEGRRRENHWSRGRFWDEVLMGITAREWWAKHGPPPQPDPELP